MAQLTDAARIRSLLNQDRIWSVYALGDLLPENFSKAAWFTPDLTLVYRDFGVCILFAAGGGSLREALEHLHWPLHLQLRPAEMEIIARFAAVTRQVRMWRMGWSGDRSGWVDTSPARRLTAADVPALERLYSDGEKGGEAPDFFFPSMVESGVFFGSFEGGEIVAAAGTHLYAPAEGAAAIGNVYTRRDRRGLGLGKAVTCAVLGELSALQTVALNVRQDNAPAIAVYESLGFRKHCEFFEGLASGPLTTATPG